MRHLSKLTLLFFGSAFIACADAPVPTEIDTLEPTLAVVNTGFFDQNFTSVDRCSGELVDFVTKRKHVFNTTSDANGGIHVGFHRTWTGTGVGQTSGTVYHLNWPWQQQFYSRGPFPETFTRHISNNLPSSGSADNRVALGTVHVTVNANGDVTADVVNVVLKCVG